MVESTCGIESTPKHEPYDDGSFLVDELAEAEFALTMLCLISMSRLADAYFKGTLWHMAQ